VADAAEISVAPGFPDPHDGIRKLIDDHIPYRNLQDAKVRFISSPPISSRATASCCRKARPPRRSSPHRDPRRFSPIRYKDLYLADGAISSNTPIRVAVAKGAQRLIVLPTGHACATHAPPVGAVANALHALTLLIARQLVSELEGLDPGIEYFVVPPLCPAGGIAVRFLAHGRSYRARHPEHRRLAGAKRPGAGRIPGRDAPAQPLSGAPPLHCNAQKGALDHVRSDRLIALQ
jgi:hypothetical protein